MAGKHVFIQLPSIRTIELHPFTISAMDPLELVVAGRDGFTRDLHEFAVKQPGREVKATLDGPYGTMPDFSRANRVVFIAGGSGASFTSGVAVEFMRTLGASSGVTIDFTWVVRHEGT